MSICYQQFILYGIFGLKLLKLVCGSSILDIQSNSVCKNVLYLAKFFTPFATFHIDVVTSYVNVFLGLNMMNQHSAVQLSSGRKKSINFKVFATDSQLDPSILTLSITSGEIRSELNVICSISFSDNYLFKHVSHINSSYWVHSIIE